MRYENIKTNSGTFTVCVPNTVQEGDGFYVSYNKYDTDIYGSDTTALVIGQMARFYILNGDHRAQYRALLSDGLDACLAYFEQNLESVNKFSDKLDPEEKPGPSALGL